jgi:uncharacterized membrane protein
MNGKRNCSQFKFFQAWFLWRVPSPYGVIYMAVLLSAFFARSIQKETVCDSQDGMHGNFIMLFCLASANNFYRENYLIVRLVINRRIFSE